MLPKDVRCYFALAKQLLAEVDFSALSQETRSQYSALAKEAISEVLEARPNARIGTVVRIAADQIQDEVGELVAQDEDRQAVDKIVEAATDKFLANSDLGTADAETGDRIAGLVWDHMEAVAKDWWLDVTTSLEAVLDDLIAEAVSRSEEEIYELLSEMPTNDHGDQVDEENDHE